MKTSFVSSSALSTMLRGTILKAQDKLIDANKEMTTGRYADIGLGIGARTGLTVNQRNQHALTSGLIDTNGLVSGQLTVTQHSLGGLLDTAQNFLSTLLGVRSGESTAGVLVSDAENNLQAAVGALNNAMGGQYIFAGINTQQRPVTDYFAAGAPNKAAVDAAFVTAFGFAQGDPAAGNISAADMQAFLDTGFSAQFQDPAWRNNWSSALDANVQARISPNEIVETSANANEPFMRALVKAYAMVVDAGTEGLNQNAYQVVVDEAIKGINSAIRGLTAKQAQLGSVQARITSVSARLSVQRDILAGQIRDSEGVDPFEAKLRVDALTTQVETAYRLTVNLQNLSILNFMK